jgi:hypothetical protein
VDENTFADNGADYYLNAGIRHLDGRQDCPKTFAWHIINVTEGQTGAVLTQARSIHEVWVASSYGRGILERRDQGWLRENYPNSAAQTGRGGPLYWATAQIGLSPAQLDLDADDFTGMFDWEDITFGEHESYNGIIWMPPCDTTYTLRILGRFASRVLVNDTDMNWWTIRHPEVVVAAAMKRLEQEYRNSQGVQDWEKVIVEDLLSIEKDMVRQDWAGVSKMKG